jgi:uncharacterized protein
MGQTRRISTTTLVSCGFMVRFVSSQQYAGCGRGDRLFRWGLGPRPADHPGLSELGL